MPRHQNPTIQLPRERLDQLRQFAQNMQTVQGVPDATMSAVIGELLNLARREGRIGHGIPGIEINALSDGIAVRLDDCATAGFSFEDATSIAKTIRNFLAGDRPKGGVLVISSLHRGLFRIFGKGQGVVISTEAKAGAGEKILTRDLAAELADLLDHAVSTATPIEK